MTIIIFLLFFFRKPNIELVNNDSKILSPTFGTIQKIEKTNFHTKIKIFLSLFDPHYQYYPVNGQVIQTEHKKGEFNPAYIMEKSDYNERFKTVIRSKFGVVKIIQIAGQIARRIFNYSKLLHQVKQGDILGLIAFGSRVDIIIPNYFKICCKVGDKVEGAKTTLAKL